MKQVWIETYGCQQNVADSETLLALAEEMGYTPAKAREDADLILFNTCAVRENAELKVYGNLGALKHLKARRPKVIIGVCGCMMQEAAAAARIKKTYPHVELVFGTHNIWKFPQLLQQLLAEKAQHLEQKSHICDISEDHAIHEGLPVHRGNSVTAYISIMYGCNNFCTYCIVPYTRGRERSRKPEDVLRDIRQAAADGYKEVMLLGQNVNSYSYGFADLLEQASGVDGIARIRFMTSHPKDISDRVLDTMAAHSNICNCLHLPLQAGSNRVLSAMNRRYTREAYLEIVRKAREKMPGLALTTDIIVGFPGETNEEFAQTLDMIETVRYDSIFSFIYSRRAGTPAATMADVLTDAEKKANFDRLLEAQNRISREINDTYLHTIQPVLVEGKSKTNPAMLAGRTEGNKIVHFPGDATLAGQMANVKITRAKTWSLEGEILEKETI